MTRSRSCLPTLFACTTYSTVSTAVGSAISATGGAIGGAILHAAGWTVNGVAIVNIATVAGAAAAGTAVIAGPLVCCGAGFSLFTSNRTSQATGSLASLITEGLLAGAFGAAGAGMLHLSKLQVGYTAAATAAGTSILILGVGIVGGVAMCFGTCASGSNGNAPFDNNLYSFRTAPNGTPVLSSRLPVLNSAGQSVTLRNFRDLPIVASTVTSNQTLPPAPTMQ